MKKMGCLGCLATFLAAIVILIVAIRHVQSSLHPVYHGKRLVEWADKAVYAEDHAARQKAVDILREACSREGEEARLRVYKKFVVVKNGREPVDQLTEELLPFLLERFKDEHECAGMIAGGLEKCPSSQTVPQLIKLLKSESDPWKQDLLIRTLGRLGPTAQAATPFIRKLYPHMNGDNRRTARWALKEIDPKAPDLPGD